MQTPQDPHQPIGDRTKDLLICEHCDKYIYTWEDRKCKEKYAMCPRCLFRLIQNKDKYIDPLINELQARIDALINVTN
jgi:uncharacterized paraquat-inducible protein A